MTILGIDTSGKIASVAVANEEKVLSQTTVYTKLTHSQVILPICREVLKNAGLELADVDGIAAAAGPGSYTGLRIGIAAVKAMCFALDKPCVGISTLESLAYNVLLHKGVICAVMAARLDLVYCGIFRSDGKSLERLAPDRIMPLDDLKKELDAFSGDIVTVGDNAEILTGDRFLPAPAPLRLQLGSSLCMAALGREMYSPDKLEAAYLEITKAEKDKL
ncbi:MAG: tRNA (adenosine(37)-N6)-threonylcarbamoyltransferase complex dimerization subunit type 1 TsaB [Oscillospiraceae bacterium]|nr:tRNA (adenosine(37)-N6)-threonylcarbamoyltransferase complex dimerization subunit type 1 TsaB [Oscillospiraceae bacterium]